jgi:mono/diheme cytochrome c family protein
MKVIVIALAALLLPLGAFAAAGPDGKALFTQRCGMCHQTNGMGVGILSRRTGDTSKGLLEQRADVSAAVVQVVVRSGIGNMPRISRAEVSNPELAAIASYLSKGKP